MEGSSRLPEITIVPAAAGGGAVDAMVKAKVASKDKEPISPGSPSPVAGKEAGKERRPDGVVSLPGWKLDSLCQESGSSPAAMRARFPYF